ncbi:MAG: hypothetical protein EXS14_01440 [Planctomycetes bacterium]|nr:hypothetical protein [Planctomycetota bacterium]
MASVESAAPFFSAPGCRLQQLDAEIWQAWSPSEVLICSAAVRLLSGTVGPGVAIYRRTDFWAAPHFWKHASEIPDRTMLLLWQEGPRYAALLPLAGRDAHVELAARGDGVFALVQTCHQETFEQSVPLAIGGRGDCPYELTERLFDHAARLIGTCRRRDQKLVPEWTRRLGWCSWNAFGVQVTEENIRSAIASFENAPVKLGFMLLDDGWQHADAEGRLLTTGPNSKFPRGLAPLVHEAKRRLGLRHFGVWHAWQGYWKGVSPKGPIAQDHRVLDNGLLHPTEWASFYEKFYAELSRAGVDFTKADNQSFSSHLLRDVYAHVSGMRLLREAVEGASAKWFQSGLLNCMSQESTVLYQLWHSNVLRNSDDFYPEREGNPQEHVLQNAWNALWCRTLAIPDWDMFQSHHPQAAWHAAARAVSGGPITITDTPGQQDWELLSRLVFPDGRLPHLDGYAVPARRGLFEDPRAGQPLIVWNRSGMARIAAVFDVAGKGATLSIGPRDVDFAGEGAPQAYALLSMNHGWLGALGLEDSVALEIEPGGHDVVTVVPIHHGFAAFGAEHAFNPPGWLGAQQITRDGTSFHWHAELRATAPLILAVLPTAAWVNVNGKSVPFTQTGPLLRVELPRSALPAVIDLRLH